MKIALLGAGKTGGKVLELGITPKPTIFNQSHLPSSKNLAGHDVIISFLPGKAFLDLIPLLLETRIPVVTGSTGFDWPKDVATELQKAKLRWVFASNFSLGMGLIHAAIKIFSRIPALFPDGEASIHEVHHTKKLDAPSGTALKWKEWLDWPMPVDITSERQGDVMGLHELTFHMGSEKIYLKHEALDRKIFAEGAVWAARQVVSNNQLPHGLIRFEELTDLSLGLNH